MGMDLTTAAGAHWFAMVNFLLDALDAEPAVTATGRAPRSNTSSEPSSPGSSCVSATP